MSSARGHWACLNILGPKLKKAEKNCTNYNSTAGQHAQALGVIVTSGKYLCVGH